MCTRRFFPLSTIRCCYFMRRFVIVRQRDVFVRAYFQINTEKENTITSTHASPPPTLPPPPATRTEYFSIYVAMLLPYYIYRYIHSASIVIFFLEF